MKSLRIQEYQLVPFDLSIFRLVRLTDYCTKLLEAQYAKPGLNLGLLINNWYSKFKWS